MIQHEIVLRVPGSPAPKGSMKCVGGRGGRGHQLVESSKATKPWRDTVARAARTLITQHADHGQPLVVEVTLTIARPAAHYGTGRNRDTLRASAPAWPAGHQTGDSDKHLRTILDALEDAAVYPDDSAVVDVHGRKVYADSGHPDALTHPGAVIRIRPAVQPAQALL